MATEVAEQQREERPDEGRSLSPGATAALRVARVRRGTGARSTSSAGSPSTFLRDKDSNRILVVLVAIVVGVGGVFALFWAMDRVVDWLPDGWREGVRPYVFVGPAVVILAIFLVYPVFNTLLTSFKDAQRAELGRARQLPVRVHRPEHAAVDPQHRGLGHRRPAWSR